MVIERVARDQPLHVQLCLNSTFTAVADLAQELQGRVNIKVGVGRSLSEEHSSENIIHPVQLSKHHPGWQHQVYISFRISQETDERFAEQRTREHEQLSHKENRY